MSPERQRTAIAEACRWKNVRTESYAGRNHFIGKHPFDCTSSEGFAVPPDYLNDLNACREALKTLTENQQLTYVRHLLGIDSDDSASLWSLGWDSAFFCASASPERVCEAFLRTLGKWEDA